MEKTISSKIVFHCPLFRVERAEVELPNGVREERWYAVKNDAVGIIAIDKQGRILLTQEYRSASGEVEWRIPAGGLKDGELPEVGAHRELREETGFDAQHLELLLLRKFPSGWVKQSTYFYLAEGLFESPLHSGEYENVKIIPVTISEAVRKVKKGEIQGNIAEAILAVADRLKKKN